MNEPLRFDGANVLISGGLGFIGSNLAIKLVALGARVTIIDSMTPEYGGNLLNIAPVEKQVRVNISDVRDAYSLRYLVQGQDYLFNLAGQTSHLHSMRDPYTDLEINCRAQLSILEACRENNSKLRLVFASTRQIYGKPSYLPVDEKHPLRPVDVNGINKLAGEYYHILYHQVYGIPTCVLRLTNTYGPRMRIKDARQTFLGIWVRQLLEGQPIEVWGGQQLRLGGDERISLADLGTLLVRLHGGGTCKICEFPDERRKIDIGDYYSDDRLIRGELGWQPATPLREGLQKTLDYYREHLPHYV